ncbi:hypothetical protein V8C37DRAFT_401215 [Trichoderma ceciliae]
MASSKRTVIELSSGSDDYNPLVTRRRKIRRRSTKPQLQRLETDADDSEDQPTFAEFLARALPSKLIASDVAEYIERESNIRLEAARQDGIVLDNVFIGRDCLPTWIGMQWDPEKESLHCAIQDRLLDLEVSNILGDVLRKELIDKGNRKLEEARQLGVDIENITIGKGLLATWDMPGTGHRLGVPLEEQPNFEDDLAYADLGQSRLETAIPESSAFSKGETPESEACSEYTVTAVPNSPSIAYDSSSTYDSCSDFSSSSSTEDEEEFDDIIYMNNTVDPQPHYSESDDEAPHILHDAEIVGGPEGYSDVDLEVYLADDDEDIEQLPELELAIDGEAFTYYFDDYGAVDVEIPGTDLLCSLDIPQDQSDEEEDYLMEEGQIFEEEEEDDDDDDDDDDGLNEDEDEKLDVLDAEDAQDEDGTNAQLDGYQASLVLPMLQSEDREPYTEIEITEDGFAW